MHSFHFVVTTWGLIINAFITKIVAFCLPAAGRLQAVTNVGSVVSGCFHGIFIIANIR